MISLIAFLITQTLEASSSRIWFFHGQHYIYEASFSSNHLGYICVSAIRCHVYLLYLFIVIRYNVMFICQSSPYVITALLCVSQLTIFHPLPLPLASACHGIKICYQFNQPVLVLIFLYKLTIANSSAP